MSPSDARDSAETLSTKAWIAVGLLTDATGRTTITTHLETCPPFFEAWGPEREMRAVDVITDLEEGSA
jgi:hypothetical protein